MELKSLRDCIRTPNARAFRDYDSASTNKLFDLLLDCDFKLLQESRDSQRVDALRTVVWFVNAALTRRGVPPRARTPLGDVPITATKLLHVIRKADAPYIDMQWLGFRHPERVPPRWRGITFLVATAPAPIAPATDEIVFSVGRDHDDLVDEAFDAADRLAGRQQSIARTCRDMKLSTATQSEMRWLCSRNTRLLLKEIAAGEHELRKKMRSQGIKQLTEDRIENRLAIIRAWKLVGGGTNWQATADAYQAATGRTITRQAVKDIITRLGEQKLIRRRHKKMKVLEPVLSSE